MERLRTSARNPAGRRPGMNSGAKQQLVRIDVSQTSENRLIQQQRLDPGSARPQALVEFIEADFKRVRPDSGELLREAGVIFKAAELPDIVKYEAAGIQFQNRARMLTRNRVPQQFAGHAQMNVEESQIQFGQNLFAAPAQSHNSPSSKQTRCPMKIASRHQGRRKDCARNRLPLQVRRKRSDDGFNFGKFWQALGYVDEHVAPFESQSIGRNS